MSSQIPQNKKRLSFPANFDEESQRLRRKGSLFSSKLHSSQISSKRNQNESPFKRNSDGEQAKKDAETRNLKFQCDHRSIQSQKCHQSEIRSTKPKIRQSGESESEAQEIPERPKWGRNARIWSKIQQKETPRRNNWMNLEQPNPKLLNLQEKEKVSKSKNQEVAEMEDGKNK